MEDMFFHCTANKCTLHNCLDAINCSQPNNYHVYFTQNWTIQNHYLHILQVIL